MSPYVDVTARLSGRSLNSASTAMADGLSRISLPLGYYAAVQPGPANPAPSAARLASYVIAALIGILLLAQAATGSWRLALLVLAALPVPVAAGTLTALRIGEQDSLAAVAGLLAVLAIAIQQAFGVTAAIRRAHRGNSADPGHRGQLTAGLVADAAAEAGGPAITSAAVAAVALAPFIVMGEVAGNELLHTAAAVILAGLIAATLVNTLVLPAACLRFGPARVPEQDLAPEQDLESAEPPSVPQPREALEVSEVLEVPEAPAVPQPAGRPENPVS